MLCGQPEHMRKPKQFNKCVERENVSRSVMSVSAIPWTVARQAPLSMEFSRQEY